MKRKQIFKLLEPPLVSPEIWAGLKSKTSFKIGDVVRLKGGSPKFTIIEISPEPYSLGKVIIQWFDHDGKMHQNIYSEECLKKSID